MQQQISVDDLLRMIGHKQVVIEQQERMIAALEARLAEAEKAAREKSK